MENRSAAGPASPADERLDSWKEIAAYLKRSVRGVQRWEAEEAMPVHRHRHDKRGTIFAFKPELDAWWRERGALLTDRDGDEDALPSAEPEAFDRDPIVAESETVEQPALPQPQRTRRGALIGAGFALAVLLVGLLAWLSGNGRTAPGSLQPLPFEARDWVLVAGFENRSGQPLFDGALEYALARELSNSRYVNVVPRERIGDALRLMRKPPDSPINAVVGSEVCLRDGGIRALLTGRVEKLGSKYLLSVEIVDPKQGATLAGLSEESAGTDDALVAMRRISNRVRAALGETPAPDTSGKTELARVTTSSLRALQLYSQADRLVAENDAAAEELLRQAVAEDPEFASAHILLAHAIDNQSRPREEVFAAAETAYRLSDRTTERERYFIRGSYYLLLDQKEKAVAAYEALLSIYPDHFWGTHALTFLYPDLGRENEAAQFAARRADLRPRDFYAKFLAAWYVALFEPDRARASLYVHRTLELVSPDALRDFPFEVAWLELFPASERWLEGDAEGALDLATRFAEKLDSTSLPRQQPEINQRAADSVVEQLGNVFLTLGKLRTAEEFFRRRSSPTLDLARLSLLRGNREELKRLSSALVAESYDVDWKIVTLLARSGLVDQAERVLAAKERAFATFEPGKLDAVRGELAAARGRTVESIDQLRKSRANTRAPLGSFPFLLGMETLASALAGQGDLDGAIRVLELLSRQKRQVAFYLVSNGAFWERNQLLLARLYRKAGRAADAQRIEADLLKLLAVADADHPILLELQRLQGS